MIKAPRRKNRSALNFFSAIICGRSQLVAEIILKSLATMGGILYFCPAKACTRISNRSAGGRSFMRLSDSTIPRHMIVCPAIRSLNPGRALMKIFEFRISLSFWYLHCAIQDAMGWLNGHLHCFRVPAAGPGGRIEIGIPDPEGFDSVEILPAWNIRIDEYFTREGDRAEYDYDFGDGWEHDLILERILEAEEGARYPRCIDGARSCPPEDCGGPLGYERLLKIVSNDEHEEHESMMEWLGGTFDPEAFSVDDVYFLDPESALSDALAEYDDDHPAAVFLRPEPAVSMILMTSGTFFINLHTTGANSRSML